MLAPMRTEIPNLRHLRAFREVAHCRGISAASERVHLSQPAITQAIAKLERQVGTALFERRSGGLRATEAGTLFLGRVERSLAMLRTGAREAVRVGLRKGNRGFADFDRLLSVAQLRALTAMSDAGNFSIAARNMGMSQPSIHRAARDLERLAGVALFGKTSRGIELTPAAQILAQHAKLAFSELRQGFAEIGEYLGLDSGRIVVGSMPLARTSILPSAINALVSERPQMEMRVVDGPYNDLLHGLRHGEIDLLIGALRDPVPVDDVVQERLFDDPLAVVARAGHPLSGRQTVTVCDLAAFPWVVPPEGTPTRGHFDAMLRREGLTPPRGMIETSSLILVRGLLMASDRLTIISTHQIRHELELGLFDPLLIDMVGSERPIGVTVRRDWRPTATQKKFLDQLRAASRALHPAQAEAAYSEIE
jgi:DNA-binding transcriptional LysR family regulator